MENKNRTFNSTINIVVGIIKNVVITLLAFISRKLFIEYIGIEFLGINGLFTNILSLLSMADLGFGTAMSFSFYKPLADGDEKKLASLIHFYKKVYHIIAIAVAVIGLSLIPILDKIINLETPVHNIELYYIIFLSNTVISYLFVYKSSVLTADQKNFVVDIWTIAVNVIKIIIQCIFTIIFKNYIIYIVLNVLATLVNNLVISHQANKQYPYISNYTSIDKQDKKEIFVNLKSVFIYKVSGSLLNSIDSIVISVCISTVAVGLYSNYSTITTSLVSFITIIFTSLTPSIGNLIVKESYDARYKIFTMAQNLSFWISGFVSICTYVLISDFIEIWLGQEYVMGELMAVAVALNLYFSTSMQTIWIFREASGLYKRTKYIMLIAAIVNLCLSVLLAKILGAAGVILATTIAKISTYFWYEPNILFKDFFKKRVISYYKTYMLNILCVIIAGLGISKLMNLIAINGIIGWLIKAMVCAVIVNTIYVVINIKNGIVGNLLQRIKRV